MQCEANELVAYTASVGLDSILTHSIVVVEGDTSEHCPSTFSAEKKTPLLNTF
jgi:hypothetical protein